MSISQRAQNTAPSPTFGISAKIGALKAQGVDVVGLSAGEPDFDTPEHIKQAAIDALKAGFTKYTPSSGIVELKDAVIAKLKRDNWLTYGRENIIISCGAKHSLYNIMQAMLDPGDEVILPAPYWVSYPEQIKLAGALPMVVQTDAQNNFMPTAEAVQAAVTPRTKAIILNSPSNPTGGIADRETLEALVAVASEHNLTIISDEIYEKLVYDGRTHLSPASLSEEGKMRTIVVNGCSKAYAMTGWRIGYCASMDVELVKAMGRLQDQSTSNPTSISQKAAVAALNGPQECVEEMRQAFEKRRNLIVSRLNGIDGITCRTPGGSFYVFASIEALIGASADGRVIKGSDDLADYLLTEFKVGVIPGSGFGADNYIRLSYATSEAVIEKAVERIAAGVAKLKR